MENTLIKGFNSKYIPFDKITNDDYEPAIKHAIELHDKEVAQIANNPEKPTFENTILALERSGEMLSRVLGIFYPMLSACLDDELMTISNKMAPLLSEHANNVTLNELLWSRIKTVKENFNAEVMQSDLPVMIDFWASWCGPCKMLAPIVSKIAEEYEGKVKVGKVNVDDQPELAGAFQISSIPTLVVIKDGKITNTSVGLQSKADICEMLK